MRETKKEATRPPLPAPFPVGARLRYVGERRSWADREMTKPLLFHGMEIEVAEVTDGWRGSGNVLDHDDDGDPILDRTHDGSSVYRNARGMECSISAHSAAEWERID